MHDYYYFYLAELGDSLASSAHEEREAMVVDMARAIGESQADPFESQFHRLARLVAGEAFRQAWAAYREGSLAWKRPDPSLAQLDILLRAAAEAGPAPRSPGDENFVPPPLWLKDATKRLGGRL